MGKVLEVFVWVCYNISMALSDRILEELKDYIIISENGKKYVLYFVPYEPYNYKSYFFAEIDAYYFASNSVYFRTKKIIEKLNKVGIKANAIDNSVNLKRLTVKSGRGCEMKNTLVAIKEYGTRFVIGAFSIQSDIEDTNLVKCENLCKDCDNCKKACRMHAIEDGVFVRENCLRQQMEDKNLSDVASDFAGCRLLGCDICQRVCPVNWHIESTEPGLELRDLLQTDNLFFSVINNDLDRLKLLIGSNYARRGKLLYLLANVMGNSGNAKNIDYLRTIQGQTDSKNLERAVDKLCKISKM